MMIMRRRLACCTRDPKLSLDFDQQESMMTYNGLESCIINNQSYENDGGTSRGDGDGCLTDSVDEEYSSCSSSNNASGSFSSHWTSTKSKRDEKLNDEWRLSDSPQKIYVKEKQAYKVEDLDVRTLKQKFAKLLLGDDITGGRKGVSSALALSNAITNLAALVFGELWKLEPLSEERKNKWRKEMDWLLSPTNYMIELVPATQHSIDGQTLEIMTPKARADIHMNLPALQKLDSMLIETLDSMIDTEFWYVEGSSRAEGKSCCTGQSNRWWLPSPQVPAAGLSDTERRKLLNQGKVVHQVFKAAKSINKNVLLEIPVPDVIREALPKSGKANLGEDLYSNLTAESPTVEEVLHALNLKSEHRALEVINRLEAAAIAWKQRMLEQSTNQSPIQTSWSFLKDSESEMDKMEYLLNQTESLVQEIKSRFPKLPQSFLDVKKIQYGKDVGQSILEAYSRVLADLAFSILTRIGEVLQEEVLSNPNSPAATCNFPGVNLNRADKRMPSLHVRHSLIDQMNIVDGHFREPNTIKYSKYESSDDEHKTSLMTGTTGQSRVWCIGKDACGSLSTLSPQSTP
ncbi:Rop guanine nucleotide exchange factor 14 [Heracleum sosnowskyi]|uniref:Rop guanine nucleotide exchange factor 14 n=1 Tax=Heracleum sosnowskyi TaxID=360622 RepID=A0AAD8HID6_9APIA|nr:Rop guanine nucleotide exchange factor 14 [Heracleum sosnowskyi]